jgi:putative membrane protein
MDSQQNKIDWSRPQRQPLAGMLVVIIQTFWEAIKRLWPILLLSLFRGESGKFDKYEIIGVGIMILVLIAGAIRFFYFRFYIVENELIIKKGWLKKETLVIPLNRVQSVRIEQPYLHQLLGIVKLSLDTAGSSKTEASIDALRRPMAEQLRVQLANEHITETTSEAGTREITPVLSLTTKDLLKLSISANHIEAFFILLSFSYGIYENLRQIRVDVPSTTFQPGSSVYFLIFLITAVLVITVLVSTIRIFLKFYDFNVQRTNAGFYIRSGLTNVKQQIVPENKIQFINWKANWIRKMMNLWMLEFNISGADEMQRKMKVQVPVTQTKYVPLLVENYTDLPDTGGSNPVTIHKSYFIRRTIISGLLPAIILIAITWMWWERNSLFILIYPLLICISSWLYQRKFKLYAYTDKIYISKGVLGREYVLLKWYKIQTTTIKQSIYQRRKKLATVHLHTASGTLVVPFIDQSEAHNIVNYGLYEIERSERPWM